MVDILGISTKSPILLPSGLVLAAHGHEVLILVTIGPDFGGSWSRDPHSCYHQAWFWRLMVTRSSILSSDPVKKKIKRCMCTALFCIFYSSCFTYNCNLNMTRIIQFFFDLFTNIPCKAMCSQIINCFWFYNNPYFTSSLNGK
jgi:hypothetical protein